MPTIGQPVFFPAPSRDAWLSIVLRPDGRCGLAACLSLDFRGMTPFVYNARQLASIQDAIPIAAQPFQNPDTKLRVQKRFEVAVCTLKESALFHQKLLGRKRNKSEGELSKRLEESNLG
jgi:hypothetical protein